MNTISVETAKTEYLKDEHLMIFVDGVSMDIWLSSKLDDTSLSGLIPTWLGWLTMPNEQDYVWEKTQQCKSATTVLPILVCPDDLDFSCTVVVCEVNYTPDTVQWLRIGIDMTGFPTYIGEDVRWFDNIPILEFSREQYDICVNRFIGSQDAIDR